jgi:hypothetical protein
MAILPVKLPLSEISFDETEGFFHANSNRPSVISTKGKAIALPQWRNLLRKQTHLPYCYRAHYLIPLKKFHKKFIKNIIPLLEFFQNM